MLFKTRIAVYSILFFSFLSSFSQNYDTLFLKPGPEEGKDVLLRSIYPTMPGGDHWDFLASAWTLGGEFFINRSLMEFNLESIPEESIIIDARLSLYYSEQTGGAGNSGDNESYLFKITEEWDEQTVTWNTQPTVSSDNPVYLPPSTSLYQDYLDIDVTDLITELVNYPDLYHGFSLRLKTEEIYRSITFSTSDQANPNRWPELEIVYADSDQLISDFSYGIDDELNVVFNNLSYNHDSCYWDFGNEEYSSEENPVIQYEEFGVYFVSLTVFNDAGQATSNDSVYYCEEEFTVSFEYEQDDKFFSFTSLATNATDYMWDFGDGYFSNLENPVHLYTDYGSYDVCLMVSNQCFELIECDLVYVFPSTSVSDISLSEFKVYPNPIKNEIYISNPGPDLFSSVNISLIDNKGVVVFADVLDVPAFSEYKVITSDFNPGIYMLIFQTEKLVSVRKLIKLNN